MRNELNGINLQLFNEGGAADTSTSNAGSSQPQNTGEEPKVVYGKQSEDNTPVAEENNASEKVNAAETDKPSFEELIKGDYKKDYNRAVQSVLGKRLAQEKAKAQPVNDIIEKLMIRHKVDSVEQLAQKLDDDSVFEALAEKSGESANTERELENLRLLQHRVMAQQKREQEERAGNEQYNRWMQEAQQLREKYPEFDFKKELENPDFVELLNMKNPQYSLGVERAYQLVHFNELLQEREAAAVEKVTKSVSARAARPAENGLGNQSGFVRKDDVSKLTKKDRDEIERRVASGERIEF